MKKLNQRIDELSSKIKHVKKENEKIEGDIYVTYIKLSKIKNTIDHSITNKLKFITDSR